MEKKISKPSDIWGDTEEESTISSFFKKNVSGISFVIIFVVGFILGAVLS